MHNFFSSQNDDVHSIISRLNSNDPTFHKVECGQLGLDPETSRTIFAALKYNTHVKTIEFLGNNSKGAIKILADSIRCHQSLEEIYLGTNGLDDEEFYYLSESLKENWSSVQLLDINSNIGITDISASYIAELLEQSTHIQKIDLSFTNITDVGLQQIINALEKNHQSPLLELCDQDVFNHGYLTKNEDLIQKFNNFINAKNASSMKFS